MQGGTYFPETRRMLLFHPLVIWTHFWPASTLLRGYLALATLSLLVDDPQILEHWGYADDVHLDKCNLEKDFWRAIAFVNFTCWMGFGMSVPFRRIDFGGVMPRKTQPTRRAPDNRRWEDLSQLLITPLIRFPWRFCHYSFWTFSSAVHQPDGVQMSTSPQTDNRFWSCSASALEDAIFHRMSYCKFLWGNPCKAIATLYHSDLPLGLRVLDGFRSLCCVKEFWDGFDGELFPRLYISWRKLQLSPFTHCPLVSHCQQSPRILCTRCFVPWFLTKAFFSKFPLQAPKFLFRISCSILLFTIAFNLW